MASPTSCTLITKAVKGGKYKKRFGERMGLGKRDLLALRDAAELHDVGIVGIPGNILAKKRRLSEQETEMVRGGAGTLFHPEVAQLFAATAPSH